jgi:hypothetical protein
MDLEYLQTIWQKDESAGGYVLDEAALHAIVKGESRRFERRVRWRDWYELIGGLTIGSFFVYATFVPLPGEASVPWTEHWDRLLLAAGCFVIAFGFTRLRLAARAFAEQEGDSLVQTLEKRRDAIALQMLLVRRMFWWYLLPVAVPLTAMMFYSFLPAQRLRFGIACLLAFGAIAVWNRWYAKKRLQPQLDGVNALIDDAS